MDLEVCWNGVNDGAGGDLIFGPRHERIGPPEKPRFKHESGRHSFPDFVERKHMLLEVLTNKKGGLTFPQLCQEAPWGRNRVQGALWALRQLGQVKRVGTRRRSLYQAVR